MKRKGLILSTLLVVMILSLSLTACSMFGGGEVPENPGIEQGGNPGDGENHDGGGENLDSDITWEILDYPTETRKGLVSGLKDGEFIKFEIPALDNELYSKEIINQATCEDSGLTKYTITINGGVCTFKIKTESLGHNWVLSYEWSEDFSNCRALKQCTNCQNILLDEKGIVSSKIFKKPTCMSKGVTQYIATFNNSEFDTQIKYVENIDIDPDAHDYEPVKYVWADDYSTCTAVRVCKHNKDHKIEQNAVVTNNIWKNPCCDENGWTEYIATFDCDWATKQTKHIENIPALGHDFGEPTYSWNNVTHVCTATRICNRNENHKQVVTGKTTSEVLIPATCTKKGTTKYTVSFDVDWAVEKTYEEVDIDLAAHTYGDIYLKDVPTLTTEGSMYKKCSVCNTETLSNTLPTLKADKAPYVLDSVLVAPTTLENGKGKYHFDYDGVRYEFESEIQRTDLDYYYNKNYWSTCKNLDNSYYETPEAKDQYYNELSSKYGVFDNKTLVDFYTKSGVDYRTDLTKWYYEAITTASYDIQCIAGVSNDYYYGTKFDIIPLIWTTDTAAFAKIITDHNCDAIIYDDFVFIENYEAPGESAYHNNLYINFKTVERVKMVNDIAYSLDMKYLIKDQGSDHYDVTLENCEHICSYAFAVTNIENLTIPATVKSIGDSTFITAELIKNLTFAPNSQLTKIGNEAFIGLDSVKILELPNSLTDVATDAFPYSIVYEKVTAPMSAVSAIKNHCLDLTITNGTTIADALFKDCKKLEKITFGETITTIGNEAFRNAEKLNTVNMGSVKTIGKYAFSSCSNLLTFNFNDVIETIDDYAFQYTGITYVDIPNTVKTYGADVYRGNEIKFIILPGNITNFSDNAFESIVDDNSTNPHFKIYFKEEPIDSLVFDPGFKKTFEKYLYSEVKHTTVNADKYDGYWSYDITDNKTPVSTYMDLFFVKSRPERSNEFLLSRYTYDVAAHHYQNYDLIIPEFTEDNYPITGIADGGLSSSYIKSITFTNKIDYIGSKAFKSISVSDITFPKSIKYIGDNAFTEKNVKFNTVTFEPKDENGPLEDLYIGQSVLQDNLIKQIIFPRANIQLHSYNLDDNPNLTKIVAPGKITKYFNDSVVNSTKLKTIEGDASLAEIFFQGVRTLDNVIINSGRLDLLAHSTYNLTIGKDVTYIASGAFSNIDYALNTLTLDPNNVRYKNSVDNQECIIDIETKTLLYAQGSSELPSDIDIIGKYSLNNKTGRIYFDKQIKEISDYALYNNKDSKVYVQFAYPENFVKIAFPNDWYYMNRTLEIRYGKGYDDNEFFYYAIYNNEIYLTEYSSIASYDVIIPDTIKNLPVTTILEDTFIKNATVLTSFKMGINVKVLGNKSFYDTQAIKTIDLKNVETIGEQAFYRSGIETIVIPNSVTTIAKDAFQFSNLASVTFNTSNLKVITRGSFEGCSNLTSIVIPEGVETIEDGAFVNCSKLKSVHFPSTLKNISPNAFTGCPLETITCDSRNTLFTSNIGGEINALVYIGSEPLDYKEFSDVGNRVYTYTVKPNTLILGSNSTIIPNSDKVTIIGRYAFDNRQSNKDLVIPGNIKIIESDAFSNNTYNSITIDEGLERIEDSAFRGTTNVSKTVIIPASIKYCGYSIFDEHNITLNCKGPDISSTFHSDWVNTYYVTVNWNYQG